MNKFFAIAAVLTIAVQAHAQTIRRVNNNPGVTGLNVYTTAQAAHDAAVANDIIIIEPSTVNYGNITIVKPLKIYGNGYYLGVNTELKVDQRASPVGEINIYGAGGGSMIAGLTTGTVYLRGASNVTLTRNKMQGNLNIYTDEGGGVPVPISNVVISGNETQAIGVGNNQGGTTNNILITNNLVSYISITNDALNTGIVVRHNTITSTNSISLVNAIYENNLHAQGSPISFTNVTYSYNVSTANSFGGGVANQNNYNVSAQYITAGANISADEAYQLKAGSPLKTIGAAGAEVGAYGGTTPYVVSGIPAIPSVVTMTNSATGSNSVPLQVTISVKANN